mmetsp:Transcript_126150/g.247317  ORF Transcript_126150/g.247317 Transcript_126150/m.247317 type:complete len:174 (-) Transcript_126150:347-868(-)
MLQPLDYPASYRGRQPGSKKYAHPDDYKQSHQPIKPEVFLYKGAGGRGRLFLRTSIRLNKASDPVPIFTNATFFVDTGACPELTLCEELYDMLRPRIVQKFKYDCMLTKIGNKNYEFTVSTALDDGHKPANLLGLPAFFAMGFKFKACGLDDLPQDDERVVHNVVEVEPFDFL